MRHVAGGHGGRPEGGLAGGDHRATRRHRRPVGHGPPPARQDGLVALGLVVPGDARMDHVSHVGGRPEEEQPQVHPRLGQG